MSTPALISAHHEAWFDHDALDLCRGPRHGGGELCPVWFVLHRTTRRQHRLAQLAHGHHATRGVQDIGHLGTQLRYGRVLRPALLEFADELTNPRPRHLETARHVRLAWPAVVQSRRQAPGGPGASAGLPHHRVHWYA